MKYKSELPERNEDGSYTVNWEAQWTIPPEPYCGVYWIIAVCVWAIALGGAMGFVLWLVFGARG